MNDRGGSIARLRTPTSGATVRLLPHYQPHPAGLRTAGGRILPLPPEQRALAALCQVERRADELPEAGSAEAAALAALLDAGLLVRLPPPVGSPLRERYDLILSPHIDDAALSLGGTIAAARPVGRPPLVVNIFSRQTYQEALRVPPAQLDALAAEEDALAARILGYRALHLGLPGAQDRRELKLGAVFGWTKARVLDGPAGSADLDAVLSALEPVLQRAAQDGCMRILAPAGIGGHLDHVLTRIAAERWAAATGLPLIFFEDLPYGATSVFDGAGATGGLEPRLTNIASALGSKRAALRVYRTRLRDHQIDACLRHAATIGAPDVPAERSFRQPHAALEGLRRGGQWTSPVPSAL
ncbi:PIG-L family deacetylase [Mangrovicella endophytica]|uniref:PIG-L family deacetylase n=1 Tax=Mangrovicella endophytica TaxID=2066697 RepID=UPI000C9DBBE5|nr:PIG-L family deacetylase [Mangrovicella endophytica]